jgi:hypothetical protein
MNQSRVHQFQNAISDSENSEYFHQIYFSDKKEPLEGYSGKSGYREKQNSVDNFINYVLRLMKNNYYPGSSKAIDEILFYTRKDGILIVRLLPKTSKWEPKYQLDDAWLKARKVIEAMFDLIELGWPLIKIQDHLMVKKREREIFDSNDLSPRFSSEKMLNNYCEHLLSKGFAPGEVEYYLRNYRNKHFNNK